LGIVADNSSRYACSTFLGSLREEEREELATLGTTRVFARRTALMLEREADDRVMLLLEGRVKATLTGPTGREVLLGIGDPGDVVGEIALIDGAPRSASVTSLERVKAIVMAGSAFRAHLRQTPRVAFVLLEIVTARFRAATAERLQFAASDTMGRLAARILELARRYGEERDGVLTVPLPISQEELASWAGASRAGAAEAMRAMRGLGWLATERGAIVIVQPDALARRCA